MFGDDAVNQEFGGVGSTSPETRFMIINRKPRASRPRRGRISSHTAGRTVRSRWAVIAGLGWAGEEGLTPLLRLRRPPEGFIFPGAPKVSENEKARLKAALPMSSNRR